MKALHDHPCHLSLLVSLANGRWVGIIYTLMSIHPNLALLALAYHHDMNEEELSTLYSKLIKQYGPSGMLIPGGKPSSHANLTQRLTSLSLLRTTWVNETSVHISIKNNDVVLLRQRNTLYSRRCVTPDLIVL